MRDDSACWTLSPLKYASPPAEGRRYCVHRNSGPVTSKCRAAGLNRSRNLHFAGGSFPCGSTLPPPFFDKIRYLKNLGPFDPADSVFDPQDMPDRPPLIRNILRIILRNDLLSEFLGRAIPTSSYHPQPTQRLRYRLSKAGAVIVLLSRR